MRQGNQSLQARPNECSSCGSWKSDREHSKSRIANISSSGAKIGLCVGGGFDGSHTQSDETCSMWKPILAKERVLPIFYPKSTE
jgi:hypothetical protein